MSHRLLIAAGMVILSFARTASAQSIDIYGTKQAISGSPAGPLLMNESCPPEAAARALTLQDVLLQAICANPQSRQAWSNVRAQAAAVGVSEAAYLPTLAATMGIERDTLATTYNASALGAGSIASSQNSSSRYGELDFAWVLFDFGKRSADLHQARQLLAAAKATQNDTLQTIFFRAAQAYYDVSDAQASLEAARATESTTHDSLVDATAKHNGGVGTMSDQLQAETTYRRAVLDRVSAEGDVSAAVGTLASMMGLEANTPVSISATETTFDNGAYAQDVDQLIEEAKTRHPRLAAARARLQAARANVEAVRADGRPTISLTGTLTQNNPSYQQQPEQLPVTGSRGSTIGIQLKIPLFEGFASGYRVEQAEQQADAEEENLKNVQLQVSLDVWKSYESLQTSTANLGISQDLLTAAERSLEIARGRYRKGVGTFTELLNALAALTDARKQRVLAVSKWRTSRLRLALSLGNLGFESP